MKGRRALVTGASRGIGKVIAARLRKGGAKVLNPPRQELDLLSNASIDVYLSMQGSIVWGRPPKLLTPIFRKPYRSISWPPYAWSAALSQE
jgi:hypothetical protein